MRKKILCLSSGASPRLVPTEVAVAGQIYDLGLKLPFPQVASPAPPATKIKSDQALKDFIADRKFQGRTDYTLDMYQSVIGRYLAPHEYVPTDHKVPTDFLADFEQSTRRAYWLRLSAFYGFLEKRGDDSLTPNPMRRIRLPDKGKSLPDHLNPEQRALLESALPGLSQRDRVMIKLLLETGLRPGEVCDPKDHLLRFCDIFKDHLQISGKMGARMVPIMAELRVLLLSLQNGRPADSPVFLADNSDTFLTTWGLRKMVRRAFELAGITGVTACPYTLRHSFGGDFLDRGGDLASLQKIMGHTDIKTTMVYTHISDRQVVKAYQRTRANNTLLFAPKQLPASDAAELLPQLLDQLEALGETARQLKQALGSNGYKAEALAEVKRYLEQQAK